MSVCEYIQELAAIRARATDSNYYQMTMMPGDSLFAWFALLVAPTLDLLSDPEWVARMLVTFRRLRHKIHAEGAD